MPFAQNLALNLSRSNGCNLSRTQYLQSNRSDSKSGNSWLTKDFALNLGYSNRRFLNGTQYLRG